jgi:hypothetical protein
VSLEVALARIAAINSFLAPSPPAPTTPSGASPQPSATAPTAAGATGFAQALQAAGERDSGKQGIVATAKGELGQVESPPGSNNSARIAEYRTAVPGGPVGPWCAYFASWVAAKNGTPLGENGKGFARVDDVYAWAQRTGRAVPAGPGVQPKPGDLIIWDEHMGIVESVTPDGRITTIEGNSSDSVAQRSYGRDGGGAIGYVRMS